ncbi:MAG TPA: ATP-binding protein [Phycicoccus sp.]|nr:ATP-binding protein [Phycicoccus sp.]
MSALEELRSAALTRELSEDQLADFASIGEVRSFGPGDELFHEGRPADALWMLLAGTVELVQQVGHEATTVMRMTEPGQWAGGHAAWGSGDENAVFLVTGRAASAGRCFVVPADELAAYVTRWLPLGKHLLDAVFQTVRRVDATARQRESIIALGTLAAGLAHEINNPASASLRALESLRNTSTYLLQSLVGLAEHGVGAKQFLEVDRVRVELQQRPDAGGGALDVADREEVIGEWLERRGVEFGWQMAPILASRGADEAWFAELEAIVGESALAPAVRWVTSTLGVEGLLSELSDATNRIAHLVQDVKTYSQMDRASLQRTDLPSGIESTLTMLGPRLAGVEVVRDYAEDLPQVEVYAAELNQVWTNLIDNAVDAMGGEGTLRLAVAVDGDDVVVEVGDTGPGIDPAILHRVFEPFFTTKDVGRGTGLGLDISRRIVVDRHGGSIEFESSPGSTTATVRLPRAR